MMSGLHPAAARTAADSAAGLVAAASYEFLFPQIPRSAPLVLYLAALLIVAVLYWRRRMDTPHLLSVLASASCVLLWGAREAYLCWNRRRWGEDCLGLAADSPHWLEPLLVSLVKAGLLARGWSLLGAVNRV